MAESKLVCSKLARIYPGGVGVAGIDLTVEAGEVHALVGLNGAGKTTLMRLLLGMTRPTNGTVQLDGRPLGEVKWRGVGHLVGHPFAYPELTCRANLAIAARLQGVARSDIAGVVRRGLTDLQLDEYAEVQARRLSLGNKQRLGLAAALQHDPNFVVLDEPTNALDPRGVILLRENLLRRVRTGAAALVSSHHLDEVSRIADRITVLNRGRVVGTLAPGGRDIEREFFELVLADDESRLR